MDDFESFVKVFLLIPLFFFALQFLQKRKNMTLRILFFLKDNLKTTEEISEHLELQPFEVAPALEIMETMALTIVRVWRGPWDRAGNKQDPYAYSLTAIGKRSLEDPEFRRQLDRD